MATGRSSSERVAIVSLTVEPIRVSWWRQVLTIARKDVRVEWRTRHATATALAFSLISLTMVSLSLGSLGDEPHLAAGVLWVILFFAACLALGRAFAKEEETHTADLLRLTAEPSAVFGGKFLFNGLLLALITALTVPMFLGVMGVSVRVWGWFLGALLTATVAMAALGTMVGAMLAGAQSPTALLGVAAFPLFFPALAAALQATAASFGAAPNAKDALRFLTTYAGASVLAGLVLFDAVWARPTKGGGR